MPHYHARQLESTVQRLSGQFPVLVVTGPRQVGKTTLLRRLAGPGRAYASLDDLALRSLARDDPRLFLQRFPPPVLIDEFQYAPTLLPYIKMAVDEHRAPGGYWLTGSQQFDAMRGITETLAGRVVILRLLGFSWREIWETGVDTDPFLPTADRIADRGVADPPYDLESLADAVWAGGLPELVAAGPNPDREPFLSSYVQTYLHRDVRDLAQIGSLEAFARFVRACAARTGQLLNLSDLARDVDVSVPTAKSWLSILTASLLVFLLPPFHTNVTKRLVKTPKLYFLDTGLACHLAGWSSPKTMISGAAAGALVESWALGEILKSWWHRGRELSIYFLRDRDKREIDFLIESDGQLHPIEVKLSATVKRSWLSNFAQLDRFGRSRGQGAVLCLAPEEVPLDEQTTALPFGAL